jgi:tetratricopeptide (TPR) repeat protein
MERAGGKWRDGLTHQLNIFTTMNSTPALNAKPLEETIQMAEAAFNAGDFSTAERLLIAALDRQPQRADLLMLLGHTYMERQDFESGLACYHDVAALCPNLAPAESCRALALQLLGRSADAKSSAERALRLAADDIVALKVLIRIHLNEGHGFVARPLCTRLMNLTPQDEQARQMTAECKTVCDEAGFKPSGVTLPELEPLQAAPAAVLPANPPSAKSSALDGLTGDYSSRVGAWRKLGTEHILQQFFVGDFDSSVGIYPKPAAGKTGSDGLPLPPVELTMGYGAGDLDQYMACAQNTHAVYSKILKDHNFELNPGDHALDWGCAAGRALRMFQAEAKRGVHLWGGDVHSPSIRWAADHLSPPFRFFNCSSLPHLPFADGSFKFIYAISVMTHLVAARDMWLLELGRVLHRDGLMVLTVHDENTWAYFRHHGAPDWMPESLRGMREMPGECVEIRGSQWDHTYTFFHSDYIRRVWGQYFHIAEIRPCADCYQAAVVLRHHSLKLF